VSAGARRNCQRDIMSTRDESKHRSNNEDLMKNGVDPPERTMQSMDGQQRV
jgi:hypothetical protein